MIVSVTLNAAIDHILVVDGLKPHDTNRVNQMQTDAGGKGINLSRIVVELGAVSLSTGFLGGGPGAFIRHVLDCDGVQHDFIDTTGETRTNLNVESGDGPPTTFNARGPAISKREWARLLEKCDELFAKANWVTLGGSLPPDVPLDAFAILGKLARKHGCKLALDADGDPMKEGLVAGPDLIKPNVKEAERLLDAATPNETESVLGAARQLFEQYSTNNENLMVVLTRGAKGAVLVGPDATLIGDSIPVEAKSTIGAGDSLLGGMLAAIELGESLETAFKWGLAAGASTATTDGTEIGRLAVFESLLPKAVVRVP